MNKGFESFFHEKRIDLAALKSDRKEFCEELEALFEQVGPQSFDQQKKFIFNPLRLDYPLKVPIEKMEKDKAAKPALKKPLMKKKITTEAAKSPSKKAPPLKRPIMKKAPSEGKEDQQKEKIQKTPSKPLKRPIMKPNTRTEDKTASPKKKAKLSRPIMKPQKPKS